MTRALQPNPVVRSLRRYPLSVGADWLSRVEINELSDRIEKLSARYGENLGFERTGDWLLLARHHDVDLPDAVERKWLAHEAPSEAE